MHTHNRPTRRWAALCLTLPLLALFASVAHADKPKPVEIVYDGELRNSSNKPVSGIYPLEFRLYRSADDAKPAWRELHWVAIQDGNYTIRLGNTVPIRANVAKPGQQIHLGIHLKDVGELTREIVRIPSPTKEEIKEEVTQDPVENAKKEPGPKDLEKPNKPDEKTKYTTESNFATVAEYAQRAKVAEDAEKLGGKTIDELEAEIERLRDLLAEHRTNKDMHSGGSVRIGQRTQTTPRAGGAGGIPYERSCPKGYVVTGIRGASGTLVDSIQLICSPLE